MQSTFWYWNFNNDHILATYRGPASFWPQKRDICCSFWFHTPVNKKNNKLVEPCCNTWFYVQCVKDFRKLWLSKTHLIHNKQLVFSVHFSIYQTTENIFHDSKVAYTFFSASYEEQIFKYASIAHYRHQPAFEWGIMVLRSCIKCLVLKFMPLEEKIRTLSLLVHLPCSSK